MVVSSYFLRLFSVFSAKRKAFFSFSSFFFLAFRVSSAFSFFSFSSSAILCLTLLSEISAPPFASFKDASEIFLSVMYERSFSLSSRPVCKVSWKSFIAFWISSISFSVFSRLSLYFSTLFCTVRISDSVNFNSWLFFSNFSFAPANSSLSEFISFWRDAFSSSVFCWETSISLSSSLQSRISSSSSSCLRESKAHNSSSFFSASCKSAISLFLPKMPPVFLLKLPPVIVPPALSTSPLRVTILYLCPVFPARAMALSIVSTITTLPKRLFITL